VFEVVDGKASYAEGGCQHVVLSYCEVYPDGARKLVSARLKSNGKFQCTREDGRKQKGRREDSCTAALERGEKDVIKYFEGELEVFENAKKRQQLVEGMLDDEAALQEKLWPVYRSWDMSGKPQDMPGARLWPMPFAGEHSVCSLLQSAGWNELELEMLQVLLFDKSDAWRRTGCTEHEVDWSDLQHVLRTVLCRAKGVVVEFWSSADDELYPVLNPQVQLRGRASTYLQSLSNYFNSPWRAPSPSQHQAGSPSRRGSDRNATHSLGNFPNRSSS